MLSSYIIASIAYSGNPDVHVDKERAKQIMELELIPDLKWSVSAVDRFASQPPGASASLCGVKGDWGASIRQAMKQGKIEAFVPDENAEIPKEFDSEKNWPTCAKVIGDIRDQSNCGCCWAFAGAEAASDRMCIATEGKITYPLSAQDVCFCSSADGCDGGFIEVPWDYIKKIG